MGNILFNLNLSDILYTYVVGKTNSAKSLLLKYNDFRICVELHILIQKFGLFIITKYGKKGFEKKSQCF